MHNWDILKVKECPSTNSLVKQKKLNGELRDKTAIMTDLQTSGRGQGENRWSSAEGQNLLVSFYRKIELNVEHHFRLNMATSLALINILKELKISATIKWPNDIYVGDNKIAGILIENSIMGSELSDTTIGIGLNLNQQSFPNDIPNPTSTFKILSKALDISAILNLLIHQINTLFTQLNGEAGENLFHQYTDLLYRHKVWAIFEKDGHKFNAQIRGVMPDGRLILELEDGLLMRFLFGEIKYVI